MRCHKTLWMTNVSCFSLQSSHNYICEYHKGVIQSVRVKRKRRDSEEDYGEFDGDHPEVELYNLQVTQLIWVL